MMLRGETEIPATRDAANASCEALGGSSGCAANWSFNGRIRLNFVRRNHQKRAVQKPWKYP
jgi:hypothetical protein